MGELRQEFLRQTISNLQILQNESFEKVTFSEEFLRRAFRQLHTIKGTSKTFDLVDLAHLSHEIENLLQAIQNNQIIQNKETTSIFQDGFTHLQILANDYLLKDETIFPKDFADQIRALIPIKIESEKNLLNHQIPEQFLSLLSVQEKTNLGAALQNGKKFYLFESFFRLDRFAQEFKQLKQILNEKGEVIAVAPAKSENPLETIGFQIFFVSNLVKAELEEFIKDFCTGIIFENSPIAKNFAKNLGGLFANLVTDGEKIAQLLNKKVVFETSFSEVNISDKTLILLNEIASHLIHNAIDHGIETLEERNQIGKNPTAKIEINLANVGNTLVLQIKDDGKGIDLKKITQQAREKNIISNHQNLDKNESIELIFSPGFSTSDSVSEISGRGIGLDAVKDLVEKENGKIEVQTELDRGTTFSIYLINS
ncbi:MAG: Hpt domain-containing protein [Pyrinomonadaceae bacterium]|nr:Hpt domain-containing protein [Pyrinomonadaceae bacterium]